MEQLINVKYISSCGDNILYTVYISRFYENLNYRRKYDRMFHFYYIFYISSSWVLILYKSIENWCYKQIKLTSWRCVHFEFVPNFQCSWRDFERTGVESSPSRATLLLVPHGKGNKCDQNVKYKKLMHCHCGTNNRAPRWTFTDPANQRWDQVPGGVSVSCLAIHISEMTQFNTTPKRAKRMEPKIITTLLLICF